MVEAMETQEGFKQTEIGDIPSDWEVIRVGDVFEFKNGLNKEKKYFGQGTPIVNYMDVYERTGIKAKNLQGKVTLSKQEIKTYETRKGDVFFTRTSETVDEIGVASVVLEKLKDTVFSGFVLRARPFKQVFEVEFCQFCFSSKLVRKQILTTASYTTRALTNGRLLSDVKIPLPPTKAEQAAIAKTLKDADALITLLEKLIAKKRVIKQGAMQELLKPKDGWAVKNLGEVCDYQNGTSLEKYFNNDDGFTVISIGNYSPLGKFVVTNTFINRKLESIISKFILKKNELTMLLNDKTSVGNIIGRVLLIEKDNKYVFNQRTMRLKPKKGIEPYFLYHLINSDEVHNKFVAESKPGTQIYLNTNDVIEMEITIPKTIAEQTRIAQTLSDMDAEIEALENKLEKYKMLKQGMMQNLLTGRIRLV